MWRVYLIMQNKMIQKLLFIDLGNTCGEGVSCMRGLLHEGISCMWESCMRGSCIVEIEKEGGGGGGGIY